MVTKSVKAGQYEEDKFLAAQASEDYVKKKDDLLWSSSLSISKDDFDHFVSFSTFEDSNVITECNMCNEEVEQNHVCREYLQRMQPHLSVVPKDLGEITLAQTNPDCDSEKSYTSLGNNMFEEDEEGRGQTLFSFSEHRPHSTIDIIAKRDVEYEEEIDNIQVSLQPHNSKDDGEQAHNSDKPLYPTPVWLNPVYSRDYVHYDSSLLHQQSRGYYFHPLMHKFPIEQPESRHVYYEEPVQPPKFVRSVKRLKRGPLKDTSYIPAPSYSSHGQPPLQKQCTRKREEAKTSTHSTDKYPNVTKYLATNLDQDRHASPPIEDQAVRKKRKYIRRTTKEEQIEKGTALWQFLMRKLEDPDCRGWIRWTGNDLEFKVLDQKEAAKQWGLCKNRAKMTFDKFSRSMRFYYSKGILVHNPDKRLTYIFCRQPDDAVYTEMLERVMKTLPLNTPHCTSVCIDPTHEHELIKLHVRRRPKRERKAKGVKDESCKENNMEEEEFEQVSPNTSYRSVGLQVEPPVYEEYHSSSMAALIAAAAQAVAVPIPQEEDGHAGITEYPTTSHAMNNMDNCSQVPIDIPSHIAMENSHVAMENSHVAMENSHVAMENSRVAMENSHVAMENSHVAMENSHVAMENSHVAMDIHHTTDILAGGQVESTTYTMDSGVVREIPPYKMEGISEEESVAMEANFVRELAEGVPSVTEQKVEFEEVVEEFSDSEQDIAIKKEDV